MTAEPCEFYERGFLYGIGPNAKLAWSTTWCATHDCPRGACEIITTLRSQLEEARALLKEAYEDFVPDAERPKGDHSRSIWMSKYERFAEKPTGEKG